MFAGIYVFELSTEKGSPEIAIQEAACRAEAASAGHEVGEGNIWRETRSGAAMGQPQLGQMMTAVRGGELDTIWVYALDCLARDLDQTIEIIAHLEGFGVQTGVVFPSLPTGRLGQLTDFVVGWLARNQRLDLMERSRRGKLACARNGRLPVGNVMVFGYDYDASTGTRVVNPIEAAIVREAFDRVIAGESPHSIARNFDRRGVPTKRCGRWVGTAVKAMIQRPSYYGVDYYARSRRTRIDSRGFRNQVRVEVPREEWVKVEGYSPPIVNKAKYEAAQSALQAQGRIPPTNRGQSHWSYIGYL